MTLERPVAAARPRTSALAVAGARSTRPISSRDPMAPYVWAALVLDPIAVVVALLVVHLGASLWAPSSILDGILLRGAGVLGLWLLLLALVGAYDARIVGGGSEEFRRVVIATLWLAGLVAVLVFLFELKTSRLVAIATFGLGMLLLLGGRWMLHVVLRQRRLRGHFQHRSIVIGDGIAAHELESQLANQSFGYTVTSFVPAPRDGDDVDAWLDTLATRIHEEHAHAVVVGEASTSVRDLLRRLSWRLDGTPIDLLVVPALGDVAGPRLAVRPVPWLKLLQLDEPTLSGAKRFMKRFFDIVVAIPIIIVLLPVFAFVALLVAFTSRGPVLYRHHRVAERGGTFRCVKFRTMVVNASEQRHDVIGEPDRYIAERYRSDPRVTPAGRFLRRWSLDELPQLFHVLSGQMSLVGPRPMLHEELPLLTDEHHRRHIIRPGLTGLWQVKGRKNVSWEERMRLDLEYVDRWSVPLDVVIMLKSVYVVITGRGAY
ncbi:MAG: sugar transferase [Actinomycetes bacterium]